MRKGSAIAGPFVFLASPWQDKARMVAGFFVAGVVAVYNSTLPASSAEASRAISPSSSVAMT